MPDYRRVQRVGSLRPAEIDDHGEPHMTAIGLDLAEGPTQMDILWRDDHTEAFPATGGVREKSGFKFKGYISPEDVRAWFRALLSGVQKSKEAAESL